MADQTEGRRSVPMGVAVALAVVIALVAGAVGSGLASAGAPQRFTDVPESHPFHADIEAIAAAGITTGFDDGTYRPGQPVSRQAMAAFMGRGFGRVAHDRQATPLLGDGSTDLAELEITGGAVGAGTGGYVLVQGVVQNQVGSSMCSCEMTVRVVDVTDSESSVDASATIDPDEELGTFYRFSASTMGVFPIDAEETKTFRLRVSTDVTSANINNLQGELIATYVPFDGSGNAPVQES